MTVDTETLKFWTSRLLLAFVLITIGFALGRRTAPQPAPTNSVGATGDAAPTTAQDQVVVYAAHMTFRCQECNQIEQLARELVARDFAEAVADGRLAFRTVDYMRDTAFAKRYNIAASTIVVARFEKGDVVAFQRLDEVWTKLHDRDAYVAYLREAIGEKLDTLATEDSE